ATVLPRGERTQVEVLVAADEVDLEPAGLLGDGTGVTGHVCLPSSFRCSVAALLGLADAVVRLRGDVADRADLEAGGGQGADRGLATGARTLDEDVDLAHAVVHGAAGDGLGGHLRGVGRRLARALEAD